MQKERKQETPKKRFVFFDYDYKNESTQKNWVEKGIKVAGEFKNLFKTEAIQNHSAMNETKAAFAGRTIRSLKIYITFSWKSIDTSTITK